MAEQNQQQLSINIPQDKATGVFSNLALIAHTPTEFVLDFAQMMPGLKQANVVSRVVTTPEHAKRLLMALQENISKYEKQFGTIKNPGNNQNRPIPGSTYPMSFGGGEA